MTLDEFFRDQISRGQPPLVALNNAAQAYAESLRKRPDCSQYADETAAWGNEHDVQAIKHLSDQIDEVILRANLIIKLTRTEPQE